MTYRTKKESTKEVSYTIKPSKPGKGTFSNVVLPNGQIIRYVDETVHKRALSNASRIFKEKA